MTASSLSSTEDALANALESAPRDSISQIALLPARQERTDTGEYPVKRALDIVFAAGLLLMALPLAALLAALIRWDSPGPVLFTQERLGRRGRRFRIVKFRTMVADGEPDGVERHLRDPVHRADWARRQKLCSDPRLTRIGRLLRRTSLDELPQLWNVLAGDMSLVGPRPIVADEAVRYGRWFASYLSVRPGLTGLWQVSGRNDVPYRKRVQMDACYVRRRSLGLDVAILLRTPAAVFLGRGAY